MRVLGTIIMAAIAFVAVVLLVVGIISSIPSQVSSTDTPSDVTIATPTQTKRPKTNVPKHTYTPSFQTPTYTLTSSLTPSFTATEPNTPIPSITLSDISTPTPLPACPDSTNQDPPLVACNYIVRHDDDSYDEISDRVYKTGRYWSLIMHYNRQADGNYINEGRLKAGMMLYMPPVTVAQIYHNNEYLPNHYNWPVCIVEDINQRRPCIYMAFPRETYQDIANNIFSKPSCGLLIKKANIASYGIYRGNIDDDDEYIDSKYQTGIQIVIPDIDKSECVTQVPVSVKPTKPSNPGDSQKSPSTPVPTNPLPNDSPKPTDTTYPPP